MTNSKKSRLMITTAAMLLGAFLLSLFLGKANPAAASSVAAAPSTFTIYLPLVMNSFPIPNIQTVFGAEMYAINAGGGLDQMATANMSWVRRNAVVWSSIESTEGTYNWSAMASLETELQNASSKGIQVVLIVRSTPEWARKIAGTGPSCGPISQSKLPAFGNFMRALVARYSVAPYNVKYWELWNEEDAPFITGDNIWGCWGDTTDAYDGGGYYAEMLKAAYPQIKAADPQAQVLVGGLLLDCDPRPGAGCAVVGHDSKQSMFLEGILRHNGLNDGGNYFDGISFHAYDFYDWVGYFGSFGQYGNGVWQSTWNSTGPVTIAKAEFIKSVLSRYGVTGKFLMNTEVALVCGDADGSQSYCKTTDFETTKAYYVAQTYAVAIAEGLRANIWYSVLGWRNSELLNADLSPRPAY
ncbi:MAG: cellulase family glycosylhydrolase, partial [Candidatus Atribacteria bacterium]|nr:cellulase family glycosylhydrolase [Candidatus Atribacteria bacterium]